LRKKRRRYEAMLAQLDRIGEDQISLTDPDSRAMGAAHTRVAVGYNAQVAVEAKNKMIIEQAVTNQVVDMGLLTQTAEPARDISRGRNDRRRRRPRLLQNRRHRGLREGRLHSSCPQASTRIDGARGFHPQGRVPIRRRGDAYVCPAGQLLMSIRHGRLRDLEKIEYGRSADSAARKRPRVRADLRLSVRCFHALLCHPAVTRGNMTKQDTLNYSAHFR